MPKLNFEDVSAHDRMSAILPGDPIGDYYGFPGIQEHLLDAAEQRLAAATPLPPEDPGTVSDELRETVSVHPRPWEVLNRAQILRITRYVNSHGTPLTKPKE